MRLQVFFFAYTFSMSMLSCQNLIGSNICRYGTIMICCKDFKQVGNTCIECDPGYRGTNCSATCPANYFGQRCGQKCDCLPFQYCNAKSGCQCNETSASCPDSNDIAPPSNTCAVHEGFPSALSFLPLIFIAITDCLRNK
ncbi:scavenger receptor class F member 2-like isoform X5 [Saccostrea cucullata]|uniref:scavenger receptor class F member 2-like isoform X5 n=1 Tax=Saccostrea cuccullata TaxID=36930 RepID=UPI002ED4F7E5